MKTSNEFINNNVKVSTLLKSSMWYTIANFFTRALVFITTPIFARILSVEEFGEFHVFANWQSTLLIIAGLEIYATVNRARFDYQTEEQLGSYISSCLMINTLITTGMLGVYLAFYRSMDQLLLMDHSYVAIMFAYFYTYPAFAMFQAEQRIRYRYKLSALITFLSITISSLLALLLAIKLTDARLLGRIAGQYLPIVCVGLFFYIYYFKKNHNIDFKKCKFAIKIAIPLVFSFMGGQILLASDKIIVQHFSSATAVAYVGIATTCSHIMLIFVQSLNSAWSPWFYDKLNDKNIEEIKRIFRLYYWFVVFCTFGSLLIGPELILILGGKNYIQAIALLPPVMLSGAFTLIVSQYGAYETFYNRPHYAAIVTGIVAVINVVLDIIGVVQYGYIAACYVTVICYLLLIALHIFATRNMGIFELFPIKELVFEVLVLLALIPISLLLFKNDIIRWATLVAFIVALILLAIIKRDIIIEIIRSKGNK